MVAPEQVRALRCLVIAVFTAAALSPWMIWMPKQPSSTATLQSPRSGIAQHHPYKVDLLILPPAKNGVMVHDLDYRTVNNEVYAPQQYSACPIEHTLQCWMHLSKDVDCQALFQDYLRVLETYEPVFPAPKELPANRQPTFLLGQYTQVSLQYFNEVGHAPDAVAPVWTMDTIKEYVDKAKSRVSMGSYGDSAHIIYQALDCHPVKGKSVAIFGTQEPWLEAILFTFGAQQIMTVEYRKTVSLITNHKIMMPAEWAQSMLNGTMPDVEYAFSYSSLEHDGLGRYGDPLDPWGDVKSMQRASCYVKPGGLLYVGVPSSSVDQLVYNAHRIYGPVRLPLLTANWEVLGVYDARYKPGVCGKDTCESLFSRWQLQAPPGQLFQPVIVLQNNRVSPCRKKG